MNHRTQKNRGTWFHRFLILIFSVVLGILFYWLLGFIMKDIGSWPGPDYAEVERRMVSQQLVAQRQELTEQMEEVNRNITAQKQRQSVLEESTRSSERSMNQLLEIHRLALEQSLPPSQEEQAALARSEQLFLANQEKYQEINAQIAQLTEQLQQLQTEQRGVEKEMAIQRGPVQAEYSALLKRHNFRLAAIKLGVLIPLLGVGLGLALKRRHSLYAPMILAFGLAVLIKVFVVMHEHFPTRYFKYVLILSVLGVVAWILVFMLRMVAYPKRDWLLKQYREAYESFFCPICSYPIRRGPLRYLSWSRRSLKRLSLRQQTAPAAEEPYVCPMCGTRLFEECEACHAVRHSLLPACSQCGREKAVGPPG